MAQDALIEQRVANVKRIEVTPELLLSLLKLKDEGTTVDGRRITYDSDGIPVSATALRCGITDSGNIQMLVQDDSFGPIAEGCPIPRLNPIYSVAEVVT